MFLGKQIEILVIDDNELTRAVLRSILHTEDEYLVVGEATNGESGLELARELKPDIICLDVIMPRRGGLDILHQIKRSLPHTAVLMVTGNHDAATVKSAIKLGATGFIFKPFSAANVLDSMKQFVFDLRAKRSQLMGNERYLDYLTVSSSSEQAHLAKSAPQSEPVNTNESKVAARTILLVDDEPSVLSALGRDLRHLGFQFLTASDATTALDVLASNEVGVILSDHRMPGITGVELMSLVRLRYPSVVRVILSGYADIDTVTNAIKMGDIYRFLTKPWVKDELGKVLESAYAKYAEGMNSGNPT